MKPTILPPMPETYVGHLLAGRDPGDVDDWIDRWHDGPSDLELHQFLGLTREEYGNWVLAPECLDHIVATRRLVEAGRLRFQTMAATMTGNLN